MNRTVSVKVVVYAILSLLLIGLVGFGGRDYLRARGQAQLAGTYLFNDTKVKDKDGKILNRAQILDAMLQKFLADDAAQQRAKSIPPVTSPAPK